MEINKEENFVSVVIYLYNDEKRVEKFLQEISRECNKKFKKYEIICVDDASTDNTVQEIKKFARNMDKNILTIVSMSFFQGIELSMNAGIDIAIGDYIYEFDSVTMDYDSSLIIELYNRAIEGNDIVSASSDKKMNKSSALFYKIFNKYSNNKYKIRTETFRILSRRAINRINSINKTIPYRKATYASCGLKYENIQYKSNLNTAIKKIYKETYPKRNDMALDTLMIFTNVGYKFSMIMALTMLLVTIIVAIYTVYIFISETPIEGWTTTMLFLSVIFFGLFSLMTIIIKYLSIIVGLIFRKNRYIVEGIEKVTR